MLEVLSTTTCYFVSSSFKQPSKIAAYRKQGIQSTLVYPAHEALHLELLPDQPISGYFSRQLLELKKKFDHYIELPQGLQQSTLTTSSFNMGVCLCHCHDDSDIESQILNYHTHHC